ncbi:MAG: glycerate kinase [Microbacterium hominis]|jgi:glycerate kinase|uniref:glycerate kinase n=1 Tax=Microbacterium aurum TaxID=36805 RepID=UPI00248E4B06|nr:glycerate kinase [Microbacterium aurum]MBZ6371562.1 glycerate kinase [Microbacterium hominis]
MSTVVIAVDSFKGTITAADASAALAAGWSSRRPGDTVRLLPMADGGEGTVAAFEAAVAGSERRHIVVTGPDDRSIAASWLRLPPTAEAPQGTAIVELANTSGIELLGQPPRLRPLDAHTRGLGDAIRAALADGVSRVVVGIGSSASTDGGVGALSALGAIFSDASGTPIARGGRGLGALSSVDLAGLPPLPSRGVTVLTDVSNPLLGPFGAAAVFAPQKGADAADVAALEHGLERLAGFIDVPPQTRGVGAAGGAGFGLLAWGAELVPGAPAVGELIGLKEAIAESALVITGEGSFDGQSAAGKAPAHVADVARAAGVPVAVVAGRIAPHTDLSSFADSISLSEMAGSDAAMADPRRWLTEAGARLARSG